eukprot:gene11411-13485_t
MASYAGVPRTKLDETRDMVEIALFTEEAGPDWCPVFKVKRRPHQVVELASPVITTPPDEVNKLMATAVAPLVATATASISASPGAGAVDVNTKALQTGVAPEDISDPP